MRDASFFKHDSSDTDLCADIIQQLLCTLSADKRSAVLHRLSLQQAPAATASRKRCAAKCGASAAAQQKRTKSVLHLETWYQQVQAASVSTQEPVCPSMRCPSCPECKKDIPNGVRLPYTHSRQNGSFYVRFRCCGKDFSNLSCLSGANNKQFLRLEPPPSGLQEWKWVNNKWRLWCRGREWTCCDHCNVLYKYSSGEKCQHTREKCKWKYLSVTEAETAAANTLSA